jgi:hypothetical protein
MGRGVRFSMSLGTLPNRPSFSSARRCRRLCRISPSTWILVKGGSAACDVIAVDHHFDQGVGQFRRWYGQLVGCRPVFGEDRRSVVLASRCHPSLVARGEAESRGDQLGGESPRRCHIRLGAVRHHVPYPSSRAEREPVPCGVVEGFHEVAQTVSLRRDQLPDVCVRRVRHGCPSPGL